MKPITLLSLLVPLLALHSVQAQAIRSIEFSVYSQYPLRDVAYHPVDSGALAAGTRPAPPVAIHTHTLARSDPYRFKGTGSIQFYNPQTSKPLGSVSLPRESDQWLLVFLRNPRHPQNPTQHPQYLIYPFNDSFARLPNNSLAFINLSGKRLDGLLANQRVHIGHGASACFGVQASIGMNLWMRGLNGNELLQALSKTYHFTPNNRHLLILFPPVLAGSADLDVRLISEALP